MNARAWHVVVAAALACGACATARPDLARMDAQQLWAAVRAAHDGGNNVRGLQFLTQDTLSPDGVVELFYPELAPQWVAHNVFEYGAVKRCSQRVVKDGHALTWRWDGVEMHTTRDGAAYTPWLGIERVQHLRVNRWLFWPAHAMLAEHAKVERVVSARGQPALAFHMLDGPRDDVTLELDPHTLRVRAVEYTARAVHFPGTLRAVLEDERNVGSGVWVAHHLVEELPGPGGPAAFHEITLWDVHAF